jgi:hypothetical protein
MCGGHPYDPVSATSHDCRGTRSTRVLKRNTVLPRVACSRVESQRARLRSWRDRGPADCPYGHHRVDVLWSTVVAEIIRMDGEKLEVS